MLVGHCAVGFAVKRIEPKISLGTAVLAALFIDLLHCAFMFAGLEHVRIGQGRGAGNYFDAASGNIAWSHSLLMAVIWSAAFAGIFFLVRGNWKGVGILFAAVLSHWILDWWSWPPHMIPLSPGWSARAGLGLWTSVPATIVIEGSMWIAAVIWYARSTRSRSVISAGFLGHGASAHHCLVRQYRWTTA